jgi:hypothetical protein
VPVLWIPVKILDIYLRLLTKVIVLKIISSIYLHLHS